MIWSSLEAMVALKSKIANDKHTNSTHAQSLHGWIESMSFPIKAFRIEIEIETDLRIVERAKQRIVTKLNWAHNFSSKIDFHNDETIHFDLRSMKQSNNNKHTQSDLSEAQNK